MEPYELVGDWVCLNVALKVDVVPCAQVVVVIICTLGIAQSTLGIAQSTLSIAQSTLGSAQHCVQHTHRL